ncbi:hypothetical protein [Candidatus Methylomicrobium oryzae]|uniref:hypothetical protein n=1 Tax=Candidatus Methylomicrobium oryzae TaxID=2802053 RepID=UPI0019223B14|nr:hypothetical protein [Methylomicrobium sp. RS1]MBL1265844.1 hypothetical protein [Methylomicrobium sp. RS1]
MSAAEQTAQYFIGWDVGGWNCDKNRESRDALVILDTERNLVGTPWRGNLRKSINEATTAREWLRRLFGYCRVDFPEHNLQAILAIDTPLGFSEAFSRLITCREYAEAVEQSNTNAYLFRATERFLFDHGLNPLSPVKDMIGSQATKGVHVLAKFAPQVTRCGVWSDSDCLTAIEAYPSACKTSAFIQHLLRPYVKDERADPTERIWIESLDHPDKRDALILP